MLGKKRKWSREALAASARQHSRRVDWIRGNAAAYKAAKRLGIFDEVTAHMRRQDSPQS